VDVAVAFETSRVAPGLPVDDGALCSWRHLVPVVIAWPHADPDSVATAVESAWAAPLPEHSARATKALVIHLACVGVAVDEARAHVFRRDGGLRVVLRTELTIGGLEASTS